MIISKITLENYLCYYGRKEFHLSRGLNIILGENGEGKTKFFEALDWLFNGNNYDLESLVSAKALEETNINDQFRVIVSVTVEQHNHINVLSRSFIVKKIGENECVTSSYKLEGISENSLGERNYVDGETLLNRIFPSEIRKYSMFKGESELNIFDHPQALSNLINTFSNAKHYEKYSEKGTYLRDKAEKAVDDATRNDKRKQNDYKKIEAEIARLLNEENRLKVNINTLEEQINNTEEFIQDAEKYVENAKDLETIDKRISNLRERESIISKSLQENYTTYLLDRSWILVNFESIHHEFANKVAYISNKKRELQAEFAREIGIKEGKKQLRAELLNNSIPLPIGVPSKVHMQEMVDTYFCKVCNRPAEEGSEAHNFMVMRLNEYLKSQEPTKEEETQQLFKHDYITRLFNMSTSHEDSLSKLRNIKSNIVDLFEFNDSRKKELAEIEEALNKELDDRAKIITSSRGEESLVDVMKNYRGWQRDLTSFNKELLRDQLDLQEVESNLTRERAKKDSIDMETANNFLIKTRGILRDIETIFIDTKERKFDEFIKKLEKLANQFFEQMNMGSFTGYISFLKVVKANKTSVKVQLLQDGGLPFYKPGTALNTSMHISILFAISQLTKETRLEGFPIIFDAPTSTYGETKLQQFYENLHGRFEQSILLTKDFLKAAKKQNDKGENIDELSIKDDFANIKRDKAFWVRIQRPFNDKKLSTVNTEVIAI